MVSLVKFSLPLAALLLQLVIVEHGLAGATDTTAVQSDARAMTEALYKGDVTTLLQFAYPPAMQALGGKDAVRVALTDMLTRLHALGMGIESFEFPEPPTFIEGKAGRRYVIVPTRSIIAVKDERVESDNFLLGIKEAGATRWTYLDGSRVTPEVLSSLFPDFPSGYTFPQISRRKL